MRDVPSSQVYAIKDPAHFPATIRRDLKALWDAQAFPSCVTLISCFIDTMAAHGGRANKLLFVAYIERHFPQLCAELKAETGIAKSGGTIFYDEYRNGLAHLSAPNTAFGGLILGLDRGRNMPGKFFERVRFEDGTEGVALNVDKLMDSFLSHLPP